MEQTLSIIASIVGIVGGVIGLLGSAREREGLRVADDGPGNTHTLTFVGFSSLIFRATSAVFVILAGAAYLFARSLYPPEGAYDADRDDAAELLVQFTHAFSFVAILCGAFAFAMPVALLRRAYGWLFATFTITMGAILVMFAFALRASN